jgi:23S rRNA-/tRNA-specific pseudouridylate synthase
MSSEANADSAQLHDKQDDNTKQDQHHKRKRGMKPRSQRDRKKPNSKHDQPLQIFESSVTQLKLGDKTFDSWARIMTPYPFTFKSNAKERWLGRTVLDVYQDEFGAYPDSYYKMAIQQGRILVSDSKVDVDYKVKGGDVLSHTVHRHEPGVAVNSPEGVDILAETDELVVVDKPGTLPVHPCGAYNQNSLLGLLETKFGKLYNVNRLDRLTSGLVLVAKTSKIAQRLGNIIQKRESCEKMYLARVKGKFPMDCKKEFSLVGRDGNLPENGEWTTNAPTTKKHELMSAADMKERNALGYWVTNKDGSLQHDATLEHVFDSRGGIDDWLGAIDDSPRPTESKPNLVWFHLACPVRIAGHKDGVCEAGSFSDLEEEVYQKSVKPSQTAFGVVRYDEQTDSTVLLCQPMTGRTHQIRLHLRFLGHSIANDPNYGGDMWYGNKEGEATCVQAQNLLDELNAGTTPETSTLDTPATQEEIETLGKVQQGEGQSFSDFIQNTCVWCARSRGGGVNRTMLELLVRSPGIWLHAIQYTLGEGKRKVSYRTKLPKWS